MSNSPRQLREQLITSDAEIQRLAEEHSRYEVQLEQLAESPYLSSEDIIQQVTLKKLKLRVKDEMEKLIARRWQDSSQR
jgi:uncharacterized protein YdcH (DUF465 family)